MKDAEPGLRGLLVKGLDGDAGAYREFLRDLAAHLRGFLRRRLQRIPDEVEDLVQETLLAVHNQRHTYDRAQPLTAWVHAIAKYKLIDFLRRRRGRDDVTETLDEDLEVFASVDNAAADARRDVLKLLAGLPEKQRLAIMCMKLEGLSVVETAARTGMSESAVKVYVHRGMKALGVMIGSAGT